MYLQKILCAGIAQETFRADINVERMATQLMMLVKGFYFHQITSPASFDLHELFDDMKCLLLQTPHS
jgi:hypothetical protein